MLKPIYRRPFLCASLVACTLLRSLLALACSLCLLTPNQGAAQESSSPSANQRGSAQTVVVPRLVNFSGTLKDLAGKPHTSTSILSFSLYDQQENGTKLWTETQTVQPDEQGHYTVQLGSTVAEGLPLGLFTSGKALWLGMQLEGESGPEQPRVLLVSVPYALKAADADTLGGKPASAYVTQDVFTGVGSNIGINAVMTPSTAAASTTATITGSGTANYLPLWTSSSNLGNSALFQSGSNIGIDTTSPGYPLSVTGESYLTGNLGVGIAPQSGYTILTNGAFTATSGTLGSLRAVVTNTPASASSALTAGVFGASTFAGTSASPNAANYGLYLQGIDSQSTGGTLGTNGGLSSKPPTRERGVPQRMWDFG